MNLSFHLKFIDEREFVEHWASKYDAPGDDKYLKCIDIPLTNDTLRILFRWKNGSVISKAKSASIDANYPLQFSGDHRDRYLNHKQPGGPIWNIFYLHCLDRRKWPIFDQHTYRAMRFIESSKFEELEQSSQKIYAAYESEYIPFLAQFAYPDERSLDRALFTYGQFLKVASRYAKL